MSRLHMEYSKERTYIEPPHISVIPFRDTEWTKGYRATIEVFGKRFMLDARWTPDNGNEVGIVKVNKRGKEVGGWEVFPIPEISAEALNEFIGNFDWDTFVGGR